MYGAITRLIDWVTKIDERTKQIIDAGDLLEKRVEKLEEEVAKLKQSYQRIHKPWTDGWSRGD